MTSSPRRCLSQLGVIAALGVLAAPPPAAAQFWLGNGGTPNWSTPGNWSGNTPPPSASTYGTVTFGNYSSSIVNQDIANPISFPHLVFDPSAGPYTLIGNAIQMNGFTGTFGVSPDITQNTASAITVANALSSSVGSGQSLSVQGTGTGTLTLSGPVSGTAGLAISAASVVLSNSSNSYTGGTTVYSNTTLTLGANSVLPANTDVTVYGSLSLGTTSTTGSPVRTLALPYFSSGVASVQVGSGSNGDFYVHSLSLSGGGQVTDSGGSSNFWLHLLDANGLTASGSSTGAAARIDLNNGSRVQNDSAGAQAVTVTAGPASTGIDLDISARVSSSGANPNFTKQGNGTLRLTNAGNTANFTVAAGALRVDDMAALGSGSLTLSGGRLQFAGGTQSSGKLISFGPGTSQAIETLGSAANLTLTTAIAGGSIYLTKSGSGTLTLSAANTFAGQTAVDAGTLRFGVAHAINDSVSSFRNPNFTGRRGVGRVA